MSVNGRLRHRVPGDPNSVPAIVRMLSNPFHVIDLVPAIKTEFHP